MEPIKRGDSFIDKISGWFENIWYGKSVELIDAQTNLAKIRDHFEEMQEKISQSLLEQDRSFVAAVTKPIIDDIKRYEAKIQESESNSSGRKLAQVASGVVDYYKEYSQERIEEMVNKKLAISLKEEVNLAKEMVEVLSQSSDKSLRVSLDIEARRFDHALHELEHTPPNLHNLSYLKNIVATQLKTTLEVFEKITNKTSKEAQYLEKVLKSLASAHIVPPKKHLSLDTLEEIIGEFRGLNLTGEPLHFTLGSPKDDQDLIHKLVKQGTTVRVYASSGQNLYSEYPASNEQSVLYLYKNPEGVYHRIQTI